MKSPTPLTDRTSSARLRELVVLALFAALCVIGKEAMNLLPNIEPVTLLLLLAAERYGLRALLPTYAFVLIEGVLYGFHIWFVNYLYVWALWVLLVVALRRLSHPALWTLLAGVFGLLFGTLCSIPYFITAGIPGGVAYILGGLTYDLTHAAGNLVMVGVLYLPLRRVLERLDHSRAQG